MAMYDYKCRVCNDVVTVTHSIDDKPTILCAKCDAKRVKVFGAPSLSFPGSGWGSDR
jgi:putative FmdB family regulatory protein